MVGIRVVRTTERNPLVALAIRIFLRVVDGLGFYLVGAVVAGCSRIHRRLGDICAGTVVIEEHFGYRVKIAAIALWTTALASAVWSIPRICTTNDALAFSSPNQVVVQVGRNEKSAYFHGRQFPCLRPGGFRIGSVGCAETPCTRNSAHKQCSWVTPI